MLILTTRCHYFTSLISACFLCNPLKLSPLLMFQWLLETQPLKLSNFFLIGEVINYPWRAVVQDGGIERPWNSLQPMNTPNLPLHIEQFSPKTWKLAKQLLHSKTLKGHTEAGRRGRDLVLPTTPPPGWLPVSGRNLTNMDCILEEQGVYAPYQAPQPLGPSLERQTSPTNHFENQWGWCLGDPKGCRKLRLCP